MKMKTRDLKKHYRNVESRVKSFEVDMSDENWYNLWHTHLDWNGVTNCSGRHRSRHLKYYSILLDKIEDLTKGIEKKFQAWILMDGTEGAMDAIYFHTENPHS